MTYFVLNDGQITNCVFTQNLVQQRYELSYIDIMYFKFFKLLVTESSEPFPNLRIDRNIKICLQIHRFPKKCLLSFVKQKFA